MSQVEEYEAVVVGAGFAGLSMLFRLRELGISARVLEAGSDVGGTWYWNRYPGARVDTPSLEYSLSISPDLDQEWRWEEKYSDQRALLRYIGHVADRFGLRSDIQFQTPVTKVTYEESLRRWVVETDRGEHLLARFVISAVGCLSATNWPTITGLNSFKGELYHTSRWPRHEVDLRGKRVGVVGTGSTGVQVVPGIAEHADRVFVFQRTPNFCVPAFNGPMDRGFESVWKQHYAEHRRAARWSFAGLDLGGVTHDRSALSVSKRERDKIFEESWRQGIFALLLSFNDLRTNPDANAAIAEFCREKIRETVRDRNIAEQLCPTGYPFGAKRICIENGYFEAFNRDNVSLVDLRAEPIREITKGGIRTSTSSYELDVLILATGFDAITGAILRMNPVGREGLPLKEVWGAGPRTYLGLCVSGFPNMFMITGPGSPSVLTNMVVSIEQHAEWIADALAVVRENRYESMEATPAAQAMWVDHVNEVANGTLYRYGNSWYLGANIPGKPRMFMPYAGGLGTYREKCDQIALRGYDGFSLQR